MEIAQFDALARALQAAPSRRALIGAALAGLLGLASRDDAETRKRKKHRRCKTPCASCQRCAKGKCKPQPDGGACGAGSVCAGGSCRSVPPTCSDGLRNGDETDIDCGGSCPSSCANGQTCAADKDCDSGHCVSLVCRECAITGNCAPGRICTGGACCTVDGFEAEHACTDNGQCCSGNCATHAFGRTCRPAGCLPTGGDCSAGATACCSFTCSGTCQ